MSSSEVREEVARDAARRRVRERCALALLAATVCVLLLLPLVSPVLTPPKYDEFIIVYDAQRLLNGQVPHRDYFSFVPPVTSYLLAAAYRPFGGGSLTVARYATLALILLGWLALGSALRRSGWTPREALLLSCLFPVCFYPFWPVASHHWVALALWAAFLWVAAERRWMAASPGQFAAGTFVGVAVGTLQTDAVCMAAAAAALLALEGRGDPVPRRIKGWLLAGAGGTVALCLIYGPLFVAGAGTRMIGDLFIWPARNYNRPGNDNARVLLEDVPVRFRDLWTEPLSLTWPLRGGVAAAGTLMHALLLVAAGAVLACTGFALYRALRERTWRDPLQAAACAATAAACLLYLKGRPDWLHMLYYLAFAGAFWLAAAGRAWGGSQTKARKALLLLAALLLASAAGYSSRRTMAHLPAPWELSDVDRPVREYVVNRFLRDPKVLPAGESVVALPEGGEIYLYGPKPGIGFTLFFPLEAGLNDLADHTRAARDMDASRPLWVVFRPDVENGFLDPGSPVGRILLEKYEKRGAVGAAVLYRRRD